jgi:hypothetical protein
MQMRPVCHVAPQSLKLKEEALDPITSWQADFNRVKVGIQGGTV